MSLPLVTAVCPTFGRVPNLEEAIQSFLAQDYPNKQMVVYSDFMQQELVFQHPQVKVINYPHRAPNLGECRNRCNEHADGEILMLWDDDDIWLPGFLTQLVRRMEGLDYVRFSNVFHAQNFEIKNITHGSGHWIGYRKDAWRKVGGYPQMNAGEDREFIRRLEAAGLKGQVFENVPTEIQFIYNWGNGVYHASGQGDDKPGQPTLYQRTQQALDARIVRGEVQLGRIELHPYWRKDWVAHAREFLISRGVRFPEPEPSPTMEAVTEVSPKPVRGCCGPKLSILINVLNDQEELSATIQSIRDTAGDAVEIVVVDDCSTVPVTVPEGVRLKRGPVRAGCGATRHVAATLASGEWFLILDSHMRFEPGWYEAAMARLEGREQTLFCATCMGLEPGQMQIVTGPKAVTSMELALGQVAVWKGKRVVKIGPTEYKHVGATDIFQVEQQDTLMLIQNPEYTGATLSLYGDKGDDIFEGKWRDHRTDDQEIPCLMGASYFIHRDVFFKLNGLRQLRMWGSDEPYLSLKAWLAGHDIRIMRTVRIGHKFRVPDPKDGKYHAPYSTAAWYGIYNKIRCAKTLMNSEEAAYVICCLQKCSHKGDFDAAMKQVQLDWVDIESTRHQYESIFQHDLKWYCEKFKIKYIG